MLKDSFYTISEITSQITSETTSLTATLQLREDHPLYQGHFPDQPVVPGVCMLQMVKELAAMAIQKMLVLQTADTMKFLQQIDPRITPVLQAELSYRILNDETFRVSAIFLKDITPCFKFNGVFRSAE
jgi:3-hydroxyacyl-[acyl-carrier-protein] dehydratase